MDQCVIFREHSTVEITADKIGEVLAGGCSDEQAEILKAWTHHVEQFESDQSWPQQCRSIAEELTDQQCSCLLSVLESLTDHLRVIPLERAEQPDRQPAMPLYDESNEWRKSLMIGWKKEAGGVKRDCWIRWTSPDGLYYWHHPNGCWVGEPDQIQMPMYPTYEDAYEVYIGLQKPVIPASV